MEKPKILILDNDPDFLDLMRDVSSNLDCHVYSAESYAKGLHLVNNEGPFAVVISDSNVRGMEELEFLETVKGVSPQTYRIICSEDNVSGLVQNGIAHDYLSKPLSVDAFVEKVNMGLEVNKTENRKKILFASREQVARLEAFLEESHRLVLQNTNLIQNNIIRQTSLYQQIDRWKRAFKFGELFENPGEYFRKINAKAGSAQSLFGQTIAGLQKSDGLGEEYANTLDNSNAILAEMENLARKAYPNARLKSLLFLYPKTYHMLQIDRQIFSCAPGEMKVNVADFLGSLADKVNDDLIKPFDNYRISIPGSFFVKKSSAPALGILFMSLFSNFKLNSGASSRFYLDFSHIQSFGCLTCLDSSRQADNPFTQLDDLFCETIVEKFLQGRVEHRDSIQQSILFPTVDV